MSVTDSVEHTCQELTTWSDFVPRGSTFILVLLARSLRGAVARNGQIVFILGVLGTGSTRISLGSVFVILIHIQSRVSVKVVVQLLDVVEVHGGKRG